MSESYTNLNGTVHVAGLGDVLRWKLGLHAERLPRTPSVGVSVPTVQNDGSALRHATRDSLTWIGHASFLVQLGGASLLIDPVFSQSLGFGVRRNVAPGLTYGQLPRIDAVLITHNHRDHMDAPSLATLGPEPVYVVPHGLGAWFSRRGHQRVVELRWWQETEVAGTRITFVPSEHWSQRAATDRNQSWWGGYVIERGGLRLYHSGDTAWFDGFAQIGERAGPIDMAMLPIGAYAPRWFMRHQHMNPEDALRAFRALGARQFVAMHWGTFKLTDEDLLEPPLLLDRLWDESGLSATRRSVPAIGETLWLGR